MKELSLIYSQPSIDTLKEMVNEFIELFSNKNLTIDDLFYYGVFCADITYANYEWSYLIVNSKFEIPEILYAPCATEEERLDFVMRTIKEVMKGEIEKPEWMVYIEMETDCDGYEHQPSNFLRLIPKEEKYKELGEKIISFLYSPNRTTVVY